jgi:hypothetical protein
MSAISFNAIDLLELINPDKLAFTCVGDTATGRRCRNPIAQKDVQSARRILATLPSIVQDEEELDRSLYKLAALCICKNRRVGHQSQQGSVVAEWTEIIGIEAARLQRSSQRQRSGTTNAGRTDTLTTAASTVTRTESVPVGPLFRRLQQPPAGLSANSTTSSTATLYEIVPSPTITSSSARPAAPALPPTGSETNNHSHTTHDHHEHGTIAQANGDECSICLEPPSDAQRTPCGHIFCRTCITAWLDSHPTCPTDRQSLSIDQLVSLSTSTEEDDRTCSICYEELTDPQQTPCGHIYCKSCIDSWLVSHSTCPMDRRALQASDLTPVDLRRKPIEGDCLICYESLTSGHSGEVVYCRAECGQNLHRLCLEGWTRARYGRASCPFCRADWQDA